MRLNNCIRTAHRPTSHLLVLALNAELASVRPNDVFEHVVFIISEHGLKERISSFFGLRFSRLLVEHHQKAVRIIRQVIATQLRLLCLGGQEA